MISSLAEPLNIIYQDALVIEVYINGQYWGHYNLREKINKHFVAQWEGVTDSDEIDKIDILARKYMWREGLNYLHGTGHGVGTYLNVHEGPHQFRMEWKPAPLVAGMTITDEPGIYLPGRCGARTENTLLIVPYKETEFGKFLQFESLTLCPIDKTPIILEMMLPEEIDWLNQYHQRVFDTLAPYLSSDEMEWLRTACAPLKVR